MKNGMMKFSFISLFPELIRNYFDEGLLKRAQRNGILEFEIYNLRDEAEGTYRSVDDSVYGGGDGQLIRYEPLKNALAKINRNFQPHETRVIYLSPQGRKLTQSVAKELSQFKHLIMISGRYAGVDQRFIVNHVDDEVSIGDYVLSGGELPSLVLTEAVSRQIEGVVGKKISVDNDSFSENLLEAPQFTKPFEADGMRVPQVLTEGNHRAIEEWRLNTSVLVTLKKRPELIDHLPVTPAWKKIHRYYFNISPEDKRVLQIEGLDELLNERARGKS